MAGFYGSFVARTVVQGDAFAPVGSWRQLSVLRDGNGNVITGPLPNRSMIRLAPRGNNFIRLALRYVARNADGTFTTPTGPAYGATIVPVNGLYVEPLGDNIAVYGRAKAEASNSAGGIKVVVTEYA